MHEVSFRRFMIIKAMARVGADWYATVDAVAEAAEEQPQFDWDELRSWNQWEIITGIKKGVR